MKRFVMSLVGAAVIAGVGGHAWHSHRTSQPDYAIARIAEGIEAGDHNTVAKYVDVESLTSALAQDLLIVLRTQLEQENGAANIESVASPLYGVPGQMMADGIAEELRLRMYDWLKTGDWRADKKVTPYTAMAFALLDTMGVERLSASDVYMVDHDGAPSIVVNLSRPDLESKYDAILTVRDHGEYWRVVEFKNARQILFSIQRAEQRALDAHNRLIQSRLEETVSISDQDVRVDYQGSDRYSLTGSYSLRNIGDKAIASAEVAILVGNQVGQLLHTAFESIGFAGGRLEPGAVDYRMPAGVLDPTDPSQGAVIQAAMNELSVVYHLTELTFNDGTKLSYAESYDELRSRQP